MPSKSSLALLSTLGFVVLACGPAVDSQVRLRSQSAMLGAGESTAAQPEEEIPADAPSAISGAYLACSTKLASGAGMKKVWCQIRGVEVPLSEKQVHAMYSALHIQGATPRNINISYDALAGEHPYSVSFDVKPEEVVKLDVWLVLPAAGSERSPSGAATKQTELIYIRPVVGIETLTFDLVGSSSQEQEPSAEAEAKSGSATSASPKDSSLASAPVASPQAGVSEGSMAGGRTTPAGLPELGTSVDQAVEQLNPLRASPEGSKAASPEPSLPVSNEVASSEASKPAGEPSSPAVGEPELNAQAAAGAPNKEDQERIKKALADIKVQGRSDLKGKAEENERKILEKQRDLKGKVDKVQDEAAVELASIKRASDEKIRSVRESEKDPHAAHQKALDIAHEARLQSEAVKAKTDQAVKSQVQSLNNEKQKVAKEQDDAVKAYVKSKVSSLGRASSAGKSK